jgi:ribonucleoside-diphosphate reductase alpha chain
MQTLSETLQLRYKARTYPELANRVAFNVGKTEEDRLLYSEMILRKRFIPAGNTLLAGIDPVRPNCCILPPINEINYDEMIIKCRTLWSDRIGIGFDLSTSYDPVKLLKELSYENSKIKLGHRPQRGNMAVLNARHPKIKEFISCKSSTCGKTMYNFNISVAINEDFDDKELIIFMAEHAWKCGDPGIIFIDRLDGVSDQNGIPNRVKIKSLGKVHTVVPCGEQPLYSLESCNLGSINLACPDFWNDSGELNVNTFKETIANAVQFLDDVIDITEINNSEMMEMARHTRRIGLGVMGWADVLAQKNFKYGSKESYKLAHIIGSLFKKEAHAASIKLGNLRGPAPVFLVHNSTISEKANHITRRNLAITCIPPTGGITLLTTNKGFAIEPYFMEANNLPSKTHLEMQLVWQNYVDNCISKTVNISNTSTPKDVVDVWNNAKENGLKGVTIYRDGSHLDQPLSTSDCPSGKCVL